MTIYKTSDLYLSAVLKALGYQWLGSNKVKSGEKDRIEFQFGGEIEEIEDVVGRFYARDLLVDAKTLTESLKDMKMYLYGVR